MFLWRLSILSFGLKRYSEAFYDSVEGTHHISPGLSCGHEPSPKTGMNVVISIFPYWILEVGSRVSTASSSSLLTPVAPMFFPYGALCSSAASILLIWGTCRWPNSFRRSILSRPIQSLLLFCDSSKRNSVRIYVWLKACIGRYFIKFSMVPNAWVETFDKVNGF